MNVKQLWPLSIDGKKQKTKLGRYIQTKIYSGGRENKPSVEYVAASLHIHTLHALRVFQEAVWVPVVGKLKATPERPLQPWHLVPNNSSGPILSPLVSECSCQLTIDHEHFVWNISAIFITAVHLPACALAKAPWFTEVLRCRNLALHSQSQKTSVGRGYLA